VREIAPLTKVETGGRVVMTFPPESIPIAPVIVREGGVTQTVPLREGDDGCGRYLVLDIAAGDYWTTNDPPDL